MRLGIATVSVGPFAEGLVQFCESAKDLADALPAEWTVGILIFGSAARIPPVAGGADGKQSGGPSSQELSALCPAATVVPILPELNDTALACCTRTLHCGGIGVQDRCYTEAERAKAIATCIVMLYKWQLVGTFKAWDLVLFSDSDVNLFPVESDASRVAAHWREMAPTLLARGIHGGGGSANFEFVSNADQSGPVNSGLFIVRPSESTYAAGMHELTKMQLQLDARV